MGVGSAGAVLGDVAEVSYGERGYKGLVKDPFILAIALFASIGGVLFGYDQGVISGVLVSANFAKQFPLIANNTVLQGWLTSTLTLGAMFGAFINGPICDRFSRKWSLLYANIVFLIGSAIQASAQDLPMLFIGRFFAGLAIGMLSMAVPLYLSELAPPNIRGSLVSMQQLGITFGIVVAFWLDYGTNYIGGTGAHQSPAAWRLPLALQTVPSIVLAAGTFYLPYSPRWLMNQGREEEAHATLVRVRRVPPDDHRIKLELLEIKVAHMFEKETRLTKYGTEKSRFAIALNEYKELFALPHLRKRTIIAILLQVIQQFTGINAIIYYAPTIFTDIGLSGNSVDLLATGVVGLIDFFSTIPAIMYLDRWGRRPVLLAGAVGMSIAQLIVGVIYAVYGKNWTAHRSAGWAMAVFIWIYIANFAWSIGCVNWIMPGEIFPPAYRGKAMGLAIATNWLSAFIVALVLPHMLKSITYGTFFFFLAFCLILFFWVWFYVPETKGVPIEEMDKLFGGDAGEADLRRIAHIRQQLGMGQSSGEVTETLEHANVEDVKESAVDVEKRSVVSA